MSKVPDCPVDLLNDVHDNLKGDVADILSIIVQRAWVRGYGQCASDFLDRLHKTKETPNGEEG